MDNQGIQSYTLSYTDMRKLVKHYFKAQGREVKLEISNEIDSDRFAGQTVTRMKLVEKSTLAGITTTMKKSIEIDDLKDIIQVMIDQDGKEVVSITNNAYTSSYISGYGMNEHTVSSIEGKYFTITAREKNLGFTK